MWHVLTWHGVSVEDETELTYWCFISLLPDFSAPKLKRTCSSRRSLSRILSYNQHCCHSFLRLLQNFPTTIFSAQAESFHPCLHHHRPPLPPPLLLLALSFPRSIARRPYRSIPPHPPNSLQIPLRVMAMTGSLNRGGLGQRSNIRL
eukprot:755386-Hanusia_phi.AAC.1